MVLDVTICCVTGKDATLTRLGFNKCCPLTEKGLNIRLLGVDHGVVCQGTLSVLLPPLTRLGMTHPIIGQIRQADHGRPTNTADDNNVTDLAHDVVTLDAVQATAHGTTEDVDGKPEEINQRLRARGTATERLQLCTGRTDFRHIPLRNLTGVEHGNDLAVRLGPAFLRVVNNDGVLRVEQLIRNLGQLGDVLTLDREANACATKQDHHGLIECFHVVHCKVRAVVSGSVVAVEGRTGSHHHTHRRHDGQ